MTYATFLSALLSEGRVRVPAHAAFGPDDLGKGDRVLMDFERFYRLELPGTPPSLDLDAARWAALRFFHACRLIVYRDLGADVVDSEMNVPCPRPAGPGVAWSVDLTFRFLPDLHRFARTVADQDPLIEHLLRWAREWPLSSVGIADVGPIRVDELVEHPAVLALYVDRILERGDASRLADERVKEAVRTTVGLHPALAGKLAESLQPSATNEMA